MGSITEAAHTAMRMDALILQRTMKREAPRTVHGNGPGKPGWREEVAANIEIIQE